VTSEILSVEDWLVFDTRCPAPIFTARPAWALAWAETFPEFEPSVVQCRLANGQLVIVPLLRSKARFGWRLCTGMPWGESTMFFDPDGCEVDQDAAKAVYAEIFQHRCDLIELTPWPLGKMRDLRLNARPTHGEISVIDLSGGAEAALARMDGKARRMAGQAQRRGVTCVRAHGQGALNAYYDMLEASARRWGLEQPTISKTLLRNVFARAGPDAELWFAYFEGKPIAGGALLFGSQEMYFWSAAMYGEFSTLRPSNALNVALIRHACDRGMRWYNLSSSSGLAGVERFKDGLGAQRVRYTTYRSERGSYAVYRAVRSVFLRGRQS
jgi:hypothetical protein